jgi:hypothetical protein
MTVARPDKVAFTKLANALVPYLDQIVFVGGWLQELYALHDLAFVPDFMLLRTKDADIATPERIETAAGSIDGLLKEAGFQPALRGERTPAITHYYLGDDNSFYAEFISHRTGASLSRNGKPKDTASVGGVTTQVLPHIDLLLHEPWQVTLDQAHGFSVLDPGLVIQIANPVTYLAQKILIMAARDSDRARGKDILYFHDTITIFGDASEPLQDAWKSVEALFPDGTRKKFNRERMRWFGEVNDAVREASRLATEMGRGGGARPETILAICQQGLDLIFGDAVSAPPSKATSD